MNEKIIFNWSGGKDSAMGLYTILKTQQYDVTCLLTSIGETDNRISMHGVRGQLLDDQAASIGLPLIKIQMPEMPAMEVYETIMKTTLTGLKGTGATGSVFGDIFLEDLRKYRESQMAGLNLKALFPLWGKPTGELIREFVTLGFKAVITCVNAKALDKSFAGRIIDEDLINDLPAHVDPCGENGEYHTFVFDGPIFKKPISFSIGDIVYRKYGPAKVKQGSEIEGNSETDESPFESGFWYCDLLPPDFPQSNIINQGIFRSNT